MIGALKQVTATLAPERQALIDGLKSLRKLAGKSQTRIAETLGITQPAVAQLEKRPDIYLSTLRDYVEALGGRLELLVEFPGAEAVRLTGLGDGAPRLERPKSMGAGAKPNSAANPNPARAIGDQLLKNVGYDVARWCELLDYWANFDAEWQSAAMAQMEGFLATITDPAIAEMLLGKLRVLKEHHRGPIDDRWAAQVDPGPSEHAVEGLRSAWAR